MVAFWHTLDCVKCKINTRYFFSIWLCNRQSVYAYGIITNEMYSYNFFVQRNIQAVSEIHKIPFLRMCICLLLRFDIEKYYLICRRIWKYVPWHFRIEFIWCYDICKFRSFDATPTATILNKGPKYEFILKFDTIMIYDSWIHAGIVIKIFKY